MPTIKIKTNGNHTDLVLEDKDYALIKTLQELTNELKRLNNK